MIGLNQAPREASYISFINPNNNKPYKARFLVQPFGSRRAPANWGRVVTFLQFVACELLYVTTGAFADDVFCVESHRIATSGFWAFKQLCEITGFPTSPKKDQPPSTRMVLLGAEVSLHDRHAQAEIRTDRKDRLKEQISRICDSNCLTPAAASKLRGKLGFYSSLLAGKLGRGMMGPLITRQYKQRETKLNPALTRCLTW